MVVLTFKKMKIKTKLKEQARLASSSIMHMVFSMWEILMDCSSFVSETPGVKANGLASSLMKMKHGMTIKGSKRNWTTFSEMTVLGGWDMKIGALTTTRCIFAKYSLRPGASFQLQVNGEVTQLAGHIPCRQIVMKRTRMETPLNLILTTVGSITLNLEYRSQRRPNLL